MCCLEGALSARNGLAVAACSAEGFRREKPLSRVGADLGWLRVATFSLNNPKEKVERERLGAGAGLEKTADLGFFIAFSKPRLGFLPPKLPPPVSMKRRPLVLDAPANG